LTLAKFYFIKEGFEMSHRHEESIKKRLRAMENYSRRHRTHFSRSIAMTMINLENEELEKLKDEDLDQELVSHYTKIGVRWFCEDCFSYWEFISTCKCGKSGKDWMRERLAQERATERFYVLCGKK